MAELARRSQNSEVLLDALLWTGADYAEMGDSVAMLRVRDEFVAAAERYKSPWHRYMALGSDTLEAAVFGDLTRARELSSRMRALGQKVQEALSESFYELRSMFFDVQQGTYARATDACARVEVPACVGADYRPFWALSWAASGHELAARNMLVQTLAHERELLDSLRAAVLATMAEVCAVLDERSAAAEVYRMLQPSAGRHLLLPACIYVGPVDHYLGLLASLLGRHDEAAEYFERALRSSISPGTRAETQYEYGRMLLGRDSARGHELIGAAAEHAARFGLGRLAQRAQAALLALG
jgi:tetratricopeptide (TPR) repeat protein